MPLRRPFAIDDDASKWLGGGTRSARANWGSYLGLWETGGPPCRLGPSWGWEIARTIGLAEGEPQTNWGGGGGRGEGERETRRAKRAAAVMWGLVSLPCRPACTCLRPHPGDICVGTQQQSSTRETCTAPPTCLAATPLSHVWLWLPSTQKPKAKQQSSGHVLALAVAAARYPLRAAAAAVAAVATAAVAAAAAAAAAAVPQC